VASLAATRQDPVLALFSWLTNVGALAGGVLMAFAAFSVIAVFHRNPGLERNAIVAKVFPVVTGMVLSTRLKANDPKGFARLGAVQIE
jgi:hypothetical protein